MAIFFLGAAISSCKEDLPTLDGLVTPSNVSLQANITTDGSGLVTFNAAANNTITYHFYFGTSANERPVVSTNGELTYAYKASGTYIARVVAFGAGGLSASAATEVTVEVDFQAPAEILQTLTKGSTRTWIWKKSLPGHLGVGPEFYDDGNIGDAPIWYQATAFEKESAGCLYTDEMIFAMSGEKVTMTLNNQGVTYFHVEEAADALGVPRPAGDECFDYESPGISDVAFFESSNGITNSTNVGFELSGGGFMSYFLNTTTYEILSISEEALVVRTVQDIDGFKLAWYLTFQPADLVDDEGDGYTLVWEDNFDTDGAPDASNWGYDLGAGGWGNNELQHYTDRSDNVVVADGVLKITAKRESFGASNFTSARLLTMDKFEFTYGKVEVRAKLPEGGGTWPAIWMLGADFDVIDWPACGEIDIMEHVGNNQGVVQAALHTPSSFGDTQNKGTTNIETVSSEFHTYSVEWSAESIDFSVDGNPYYSYNPATKDNQTYPFNKDFFIILNVAMGGDLGGDIDPAFTESAMEVDYVRVYQK